MWLHLVNGVYCFLPKDSCSLIWPLNHPLFSSLTFSLPILSSPSAQIHIMDIQRYSITVRRQLHTEPKANEWSRNRHQTTHTHKYCLQVKGNLCSQKRIGKKKWNFKDRLWGHELATLQEVTHSPLSESFTTSDDPLCSRNLLGKQGGPRLAKKCEGRESLGREVCACMCVQVCCWIRYTPFNPPTGLTSTPFPSHNPNQCQPL